MDTGNYRELCEWLLQGVESGRFRVEKQSDSEGRIVAVHFTSAERPARIEPPYSNDPRRAAPDRYRKARPL